MNHPKFLVVMGEWTRGEKVLCADAAKVEIAILGKQTSLTQVYTLTPVSMEVLQQSGTASLFRRQLESEDYLSTLKEDDSLQVGDWEHVVEVAFERRLLANVPHAVIVKRTARPCQVLHAFRLANELDVPVEVMTK